MIDMICAVDEQWGLGYQGKLLYHLKKDMEQFRNITMGKTIVMGRKTYESLPGQKALEGRDNVVLTRGNKTKIKDGFQVVDSLETVLKIASEKPVVIIGGETLYRQFLPYAKHIYVTKVKDKGRKADVYMPNLDELLEWHITNISPVYRENTIEYEFYTYEGAVT